MCYLVEFLKQVTFLLFNTVMTAAELTTDSAKGELKWINSNISTYAQST